MTIYKVFEKTQFGETHVSYWASEDKANTEKDRLVQQELNYLASMQNAASPEFVESHYHVNPIEVRE